MLNAANFYLLGIKLTKCKYIDRSFLTKSFKAMRRTCLCIERKHRSVHCCNYQVLVSPAKKYKNNYFFDNFLQVEMSCRCTKTGGLNHLFRRNIVCIHGHGKWFLKNCISYLWSEEIIVIGYNLVFFTILWRIFLP